MATASPGYSRQRFINDPAFLSDVVRFDLPRLGPVDGLRTVHLQCHIGTGTLSLHRLGAKVTGLDFSGASLAEARALAAATGAPVDYVEADVHDAPKVLDPGAFDLVYTGIGAICWLPDIRRWAGVVAALLRPGGRLFIREGHPMLWALDETRPDGVLAVDQAYFEREEPLAGQVVGHGRRAGAHHAAGARQRPVGRAARPDRRRRARRVPPRRAAVAAAADVHPPGAQTVTH